MDRRDFLIRTSAVCGITVALASSKLGQMAFINSALAAEGGTGHASSLERKLSEFALAIRYQDLPPDVVASAKRVLLDTLACALGAVGNEPATIAEKTVRKTYGEGNAATIIGYPVGATLEGAVFVNGVLVRSLDLNDTYIGTDPLHPSEVLPTVLALCEEGGRSGRDFIEALVAGYEAGMRVNDAVSFMERGFHPLMRRFLRDPSYRRQGLGIVERGDRKCGRNISRARLYLICRQQRRYQHDESDGICRHRR